MMMQRLAGPGIWVMFVPVVIMFTEFTWIQIDHLAAAIASAIAIVTGLTRL